MSLARAIATFDRRFPELRKPWLCFMACNIASYEFRLTLRGSRVLHLLGSNRHFYRRIDDYPSKDPYYYHAVVEWRGRVIDWTRRQLDPSCPHPFVQSLDSLRREWIRIARTSEELGL